jgi:hypothetical protein
MIIESTNSQQYDHVRYLLENSIQNNDNIIILFSGGGNGKSHLTQEMSPILDECHYNIFNPEETYDWDEVLFRDNLSFSPDNKKMIHLLFNPFIKWNISQPEYVEVIDMNHIQW